MRVWSDSNKLEHCRSPLIIFSQSDPSDLRACSYFIHSTSRTYCPCWLKSEAIYSNLFWFCDAEMITKARHFCWWGASHTFKCTKLVGEASPEFGLFIYFFYMQLLQSAHLPQFSQICVCCVACNTKWSPPAARVGYFNLSCGCRMVW